jgi:hypothetical protein
VAIALAGAGAVAGGAGIPRRVVSVVRTGLCIVGGDVCRTADARAEGLDPCLTDEHERGGRVGVSIVMLHLEHAGTWTVAERSDGSVLLTSTDDDAAGLAAGIGADVPGVGISIGASGTADLSLAHGRAWELPSGAAAARILAAARRGEQPRTPPTWRFGDAGLELRGELGGNLGISRPGSPSAIGHVGVPAALSLTALEASAGASAGVRVGRGRRTTYVHVHADATSPLFSSSNPVSTTSAAPHGGNGGPLLVGLTRDVGGLRELTFERAQAGAGPGQVVDTVARLDLRDPENLAAVRPLLSVRLPWPPAIASALHEAIARTVAAGTVERSTYAITDRSHDLSFAIRAGEELGLDLDSIDVERHLVAASAWTAGSPERRRFDCVPGTTA